MRPSHARACRPGLWAVPLEPGDADWGVKLEDVRGQAEAKEEVRQVVTLWQSGEAFEPTGDKRERGLLMLGAPGTGKTMLSKAIATGFNCPFVSIPGSGFAGMFLGMDAINGAPPLHARAKKLAAKWGGQCIVFIDEIDAVGQRRSSLGAGMTGAQPVTMEELCFFGPNGSLTPSGDLLLETRAWRERLFTERDAATREGPVGPRGDREPHLPWRRGRDVRGRSARAEPAPGRDGRNRGDRRRWQRQCRHQRYPDRRAPRSTKSRFCELAPATGRVLRLAA